MRSDSGARSRSHGLSIFTEEVLAVDMVSDFSLPPGQSSWTVGKVKGRKKEGQCIDDADGGAITSSH